MRLLRGGRLKLHLPAALTELYCRGYSALALINSLIFKAHGKDDYYHFSVGFFLT